MPDFILYDNINGKFCFWQNHDSPLFGSKYIHFYSHKQKFFIERWISDNLSTINIMYPDERNAPGARAMAEENHNCKLKKLVIVYAPIENFKKYVKSIEEEE